MNRQQRKAEAQARKDRWVEEWKAQLLNHLQAGATFTRATEIMTRDYCVRLRKDPQRRQELELAWTEFFERWLVPAVKGTLEELRKGPRTYSPFDDPIEEHESMA